MKISVAVSTRNEEKNIGDCLKSVEWADEIIVFDQRSTDKTAPIARRFTKKIYFVDYNPMFHETKQMAIDRCTGDWIMSLDADERVTTALRDEIRAVVETNSGYAGFQIPRKSLIFGKWLEHTGWYPDYQVKLFKRNKGYYPCETVHEMIKVAGEISTLKNDLLHYHYATIDQFIDRLNRYTTNDAQYLVKKGEKVSWEDAIRFPAQEFIKRFFAWDGYRDGLHGLVLSLLMAFYRLVVFAKLWERAGFWQKVLDLNDVQRVVVGEKKELDYWQKTSEIKNSRWIWERWLRRLDRKLST